MGIDYLKRRSTDYRRRQDIVFQNRMVQGLLPRARRCTESIVAYGETDGVEAGLLVISPAAEGGRELYLGRKKIADLPDSLAKAYSGEYLTLRVDTVEPELGRVCLTILKGESDE